MVNYYSGSNSNKFYPNCFGKEIDLRIELATILYGSDNTCVHSYPVLYRRLSTTRCTCWNNVTHEGDPRCPYCFGAPYLFSEEVINVRSIIDAPIYGKSLSTLDANIQAMHIPSALFYADYTTNPKIGDFIISIKLDNEGRIFEPIQKIRKWKNNLVEHMRSDNGRVEFYRISCVLEPLS
jgi:hypothetical protein